MSKINMLGRKCGRLLVIADGHRAVRESCIWRCQCDCGNVVEVMGANLRDGTTRSCGCLQKEAVRRVGLGHVKHGDKRAVNPARLYIVWTSMKDRCYNSNEPAFKYYGGKGIVVCDEWRTNYPAFKKWALSRGYEDNLTIDRIDSEGNYCPANCRWVTKSENTRNRWAAKEQKFKMLTAGRMQLEEGS